MSCFQCSSFVPYCYDELKPVIGMSFDSLDAVEEFYKTYAHVAGFAVSIRAQAKVLDVVVNKRFFCMRQGFMRKKNSNIAPVGKKKKAKDAIGRVVEYTMAYREASKHIVHASRVQNIYFN
jgi:hypothetical protein